MEIRKVKTIEEAKICDSLLTKLIQDESKYNEMINPNFIVNNYFENIYNNENNTLLIAVTNNEIVGYIFVKTIEAEIENQRLALIDGLFVLEEYRGKGIASSLINESLKWTKENNINIVKIKVMSNNINAVKLYEKFKFTELSKEMILSVN